MLVKRWSLAGALILLVLLAVPVLAAQVVTSVHVSDQPDRVDITIRALHPLSLTPFASASGGYVGFEVPAKCIAKSGRSIIQSGGIYSVRFGMYTSNPPRTRIVVTMTAPVKYSTSKSADRCAVTISIWKVGRINAALRPIRIAKGSDSGAEIVSPLEPGDVSAVRPMLVRQIARAVEPQQAKSSDISVDFIAADINDVLKALSVQSGANIVTGPDVKGEVTVSLNKVDLDEALGYVTKLSGFSYTKSGNTYLVGSARGISNVTGAAAGNDVVETVAIRYANTDDVAKTLQEQVPGVRVSVGNTMKREESYGAKAADTAEGDKASTDKSSGDKSDTSKDLKDVMSRPAGVLVLKGSVQDVAFAKEIVAKIEVSVRDGGANVTTKLYKIKYVDADELAKMAVHTFPCVSVVYGPRMGFQRISGDRVQSGTTYAADSNVNQMSGEMYKLREQPSSLILTGPKDDVEKIVSMFEQVDVKKPQLLIEAKVIDINDDAAKNIGVEWLWSSASTSIGIGIKPSHSPIDIEATLNLMVETNKARVLANPKVAMISGKPGRIFIGDEVRYISEVTLGPGSSSQTTEVVPVGILLDVVGEVGPDNDITMYLHPEVSTITKFVSNIPQVARRYTDSTIRVKDGQTIVIGGLIKDEERVIMSKIPLLADLPFLGKLFQNTNKNKIHSEVAILITATVLPD